MVIVGMTLQINLIFNMKLVYIKYDSNVLDCFNLEIDKVYEVMSSYDDKIKIEEESMLYDKRSFITLEKYN